MSIELLLALWLVVPAILVTGFGTLAHANRERRELGTAGARPRRRDEITGA